MNRRHVRTLEDFATRHRMSVASRPCRPTDRTPDWVTDPHRTFRVSLAQPGRGIVQFWLRTPHSEPTAAEAVAAVRDAVQTLAPLELCGMQLVRAAVGPAWSASRDWNGALNPAAVSAHLLDEGLDVDDPHLRVAAGRTLRERFELYRQAKRWLTDPQLQTLLEWNDDDPKPTSTVDLFALGF